MTYAELVQKISDYTEVDSNVLTSTIVNGFIEDAEWRIYRDVDSDSNRRYATANLVTNDRFISTPAEALVSKICSNSKWWFGIHEKFFRI
jgi:hypothetical protein